MKNQNDVRGNLGNVYASTITKERLPLAQRKLFIVGTVSLNCSDELVVVIDTATSNKKTSYNSTTRNKQKSCGKAKK